MNARRAVVLGGGFAGLATALRLARDGHTVTLVERDALTDTAPADAFGWPRGGISHFRLPHAFIPRGCKELADGLPDVWDTLLANGAREFDVRCRLHGAARAGDEDLRYLGVRRPMIEWGLRRAVHRQPGLTLAAPAVVSGLRRTGGAVSGVETDRGPIDADVVVDAMGRRSPVRSWLAAAGLPEPHYESSDCGVIYYARYRRLRPGRTLPDGPWLFSPRGDLGYLGYTSFPGDNATFSLLFAVPIGVDELKVLRHEPAFDAAMARMPVVGEWTSPDWSTPDTPVLPMGGLRNSILEPDGMLPSGLFLCGDSLGHGDPVLAHGLSFALIHATALARALAAHADVREAALAYEADVMPLVRERYAFATALDRQRLAMWTGGPVDFTRAAGDYELFTLVAGGAVALADDDVLRVFVRRFGLLDSTRVLDDDEPLQQRIERRFAELRAARPPAPPIAREELLAVANAALAG